MRLMADEIFQLTFQIEILDPDSDSSITSCHLPEKVFGYSITPFRSDSKLEFPTKGIRAQGKWSQIPNSENEFSCFNLPNKASKGFSAVKK